MENKKTIKINFKFFCEGFDPENNFFTYFLRKRYKVIISDTPDFIFYSVYPGTTETKDLSKKGDFLKRISPKLYYYARKIYPFLKNPFKFRKIQVPSGNFVKIFYAAEHTKPNMSECDWAIGSHFEEEINHPNYMRMMPYIMNDYKIKNFGNPPLKKNLNITKIKKEKTKFCNFIYSQEIPARNEFFKELSKYKGVDAPGRCMNNMPPIGSDDPKKSRLAKNWMHEKLRFIKPYKFTIAFENASKSGWVTEKLTHPMLVNSVPIYFGHKDIEKDFNTKSFINISDFPSVQELIEHVKKVDNDDALYEKYLREPWYKDNKYSKDIQTNDEEILKKFEKIFG